MKYPSGTEIETFSDKEKLSESVSSRHTLKQRLKGHSLSRKQTVKEGTLKHWVGRKNMPSKNMSKYK